MGRQWDKDRTRRWAYGLTRFSSLVRGTASLSEVVEVDALEPFSGQAGVRTVIIADNDVRNNRIGMRAVVSGNVETYIKHFMYLFQNYRP